MIMLNEYKDKIELQKEIWYNKLVTVPQTGNRKGVNQVVEYLLTFINSVLANVTAYYFCEWLDREVKR